MDEIRYLDFDLSIEERAGEGYTARVLNSPSGQAAVNFRPPFSELELENFLLRVGRTRRGVRRLESPEMEEAKAFGGRLFQAVFSGDVRGCLRSSLDEASRQGAGLRVRLRLARAHELVDVPWEYLYNPALNRFLVLSVETPLVRYLDLPERIRPLTVTPPLRVLVMISCPSDYPQLDVEREWTRLREALGDLEQRGLVVLERLEEATLLALQRRLRRGAYHIFHFMGHGGFDERAQDGVLLLEDEGGRSCPVSGQYLGTLLHDERTLRLAILNACEGARTSRTDPFAGTAQSLVQQGIPAVVAMQFEITDEAAVTMAHELYAALADGYPVDAALAEARKAIFAQENDVEWGTPVLYLRAPDGRIFDIERVSEAERRTAQVTAIYREAQAAMAREDWATAVERLQALMALEPGNAEAAAKLSQARKMQELESLYTMGRRQYEAGRWRQALEYFRRVQDMGGDYKGVGTLIATAERAQAQEKAARVPKPALSGLGRWLWVGVPAALVLLLLICVGVYFIITGVSKDTTSPTVQVTHSPSEPTSAESIIFRATASDDGDISRIQMVVDGEPVKECAGSPCVYEGGPYADRDSVTCAAIAWDAAGNRGESGDQHLALLPLEDTTSPTVQVTHLPSEPTSAESIIFRATASDDGDISRIQMVVDGEPVKECAGSPCVYEGGPYADRDSITCAAIAWDAAGNRGESGDQRLSLSAPPDTTPPTVQVTYSPSDPTSADPVTFRATASDEGGLSRVQILVDGETVKECAGSPCVHEGGPYTDRSSVTCAAIAWDAAGNRGESGDQRLSLSAPPDTTPPTVQVTYSPSDPTSADPVTFRATASDEGGLSRVQILVNAVLAKECPGSPCEYVGGPYAAGDVTYGANAYDQAGNRAWTGYSALSVGLLNSFSFDRLPDGTRITNGVVLRGDEFSAWGLRLSAAPAGTYCADAQAAIRVGGYGFTTPYLTTASPGDTARCNTVPVRIEFTTPVRAVTLRFAGAEKEYVLKAYGQSGQELGTVTKQGQLDQVSDVTYRSAGANIARVEFGYQAAVTMVFQVTVER